MPTSFFPFSGAKKLATVLVYPGVGYGTQAFVEDRLLSGVLSDLDAPVLVAIAPTATTPYSQVQREIESFAQSAGIVLEPAVLVGWSGGAKGVSAANKAGHPYPSIMLADPSPIEGAVSDSRAEMWYQPQNWTGSQAFLGEAQRSMAQTMGNRATLVEGSHNEILDLVITKAVKKSRGKWIPLALGAGAIFLLLSARS